MRESLEWTPATDSFCCCIQFGTAPVIQTKGISSSVGRETGSRQGRAGRAFPSNPRWMDSVRLGLCRFKFVSLKLPHSSFLFQ